MGHIDLGRAPVLEVGGEVGAGGADPVLVDGGLPEVGHPQLVGVHEYVGVVDRGDAVVGVERPGFGGRRVGLAAVVGGPPTPTDGELTVEDGGDGAVDVLEDLRGREAGLAEVVEVEDLGVGAQGVWVSADDDEEVFVCISMTTLCYLLECKKASAGSDACVR